MLSISNSLNEIIKEAIGEYEVIESLRESSKRTSVYLVSSKGQRYYIKLFRRRARFEPELFAYLHWNKAIEAYTPELVTIVDDGGDEFGLVMTELEGIILRETSLSKQEEYGNYRKAGQLIRKLQDSTLGDFFGRPSMNGDPIEDYYTCPVKYLWDSLKETEEGLKSIGKLTPREEKLLTWAFEKVHLFENEKPVPVSWDSTPGNWLVTSEKEFSGFIDFENMRWGVRSDSFGILYERYFLDDMNREKAFFEGYGLDYLAENRDQIMFVLIKMGLNDLYYGTKFENERSLTLGTRLIDWIDESLCSDTYNLA